MDAPFPQLFESYADAIAGLPAQNRLFKTDLLVEQFRVFRGENVEIYYAPFDFVNVEAKIAIVGIAPGWTHGNRVPRSKCGLAKWRKHRRRFTKGKRGSELCRGNEEESGENAG